MSNDYTQYENDLRASIAAIHWRLNQGNVDQPAIDALIDECETFVPELKRLRKNIEPRKHFPARFRARP